MRDYTRGASRSQTMTNLRGLKGSKRGPAGPALKLSDLDHDTRAIINAMIARGYTPEQIAIQTGAPLNLIQTLNRYT